MHPRWTIDAARLRGQQVTSVTTDREFLAVAKLNEVLCHSMEFRDPSPASERCMAHAIHVIMHTADSTMDPSSTLPASASRAVSRAEHIVAKAQEIYPVSPITTTVV